MPIHDWTRVTAGTYHAFHVAWIAELQRALNSGVLPRNYYVGAYEGVPQRWKQVIEAANGSPGH